jgi:hypothetical protein
MFLGTVGLKNGKEEEEEGITRENLREELGRRK